MGGVLAPMSGARRRVVMVAMVILPLVAAFSCGRMGALSPEQVFKRASPSVVTVEYYGGPSVSGVAPLALGSGVVIGPGEVVTNQHVILQYLGYIRVRQGKIKRLAFVKFMDRGNDLCILTVPGLNAPSVSMAESGKAKVGDRVYAIGAPEGLDLTLSEGLVSGLRAPGEDRQAQVIQTTAAISHGSSGGGLFDRRGRLLGITTAFLAEGQSLNFAVGSDLLREDLDKSRAPCYGLLAKALACIQAGRLKAPPPPPPGYSELPGGVNLPYAGPLIKQVEADCPTVPEAWYLSLLYADSNSKIPWNEFRALIQQSERKQEMLLRAVKLEPRFHEAWSKLASELEWTGLKMRKRNGGRATRPIACCRICRQDTPCSTTSLPSRRRTTSGR